MCEIKINNNITEEPCELYGPGDKYIGQIKNILSFYDIRCQIKESGLTGYYIMYHNGQLKSWPDDLFPKIDDYLSFMIS